MLGASDATALAGVFRIDELMARVEFYVSDTNSKHVVKTKANQQIMQDFGCGLQREKKTHNNSRMTAKQVVMSLLENRMSSEKWCGGPHSMIKEKSDTYVSTQHVMQNLRSKLEDKVNSQ